MRDWLFDHPKNRAKLMLVFKLIPLVIVLAIHLPFALFWLISDDRGRVTLPIGTKAYTIGPREGEGLWYQETSPARGRPYRLPLPIIDYNCFSLAAAVPAAYAVLLTRDRIGKIPRITPEQRWLRTYESCKCPLCNYDIRATPNRCPECGSNIGAIAEELRQRVRESHHKAH